MKTIKKLIKLVILIMALGTIMAGLTGCNGGRNHIKDNMKEDLKNEYGEEFEIIWMQGSLFGTDYEAYASPVSNPDIRFYVFADKYGRLKEYSHGNYYAAKVRSDFSRELIEIFEVNGIEAYCHTETGDTIATINSLDVSVKEYMELNPNCNFFATVIFNESDAMNNEVLNKMVKSLEEVNKRYSGINLYGKFFFYDNEGYLKTKEFFKSTVHPSETIMEEYDIKYSCWNGLKDNKLDYTSEEMLENLKENNVVD